MNGSVLMLLNLVADGIGVIEEVSKLAQRIKAGEEITQQDIDEVRAKSDQARIDWSNAAQNDKEG